MAETKAPCSNCLRETIHKILHSAKREIPRSWWPENKDELLEPQPDGHEWKPDTFELIECAGCGRVSFAHRYMDLTGWSEEFEDRTLEEGVDYYPPPISRKKPPWREAPIRLDDESDRVPFELYRLFDEIYETVTGGQCRLALMGIRALLEQVMIIEIGDQGSFGRNLDTFHDKGYVSVKQRNALSAVLDAGHAAIHRSYEPTESDLNTALDITEGIFEAVYVHGNTARELSRRVPARRRTGKIVPLKLLVRCEPKSCDDGGESQ